MIVVNWLTVGVQCYPLAQVIGNEWLLEGALEWWFVPDTYPEEN